jgi:hypothetical protein
MEPVERRRKRAAELARLFPCSAELMYFYLELLKVPVSGIPSHAGGLLGQFFDRLGADPDPVASRPNLICCATPVRVHHDREFPHITIEACDLCGLYRKCVDVSLDPEAVPEVDDLASVPLDLWAVAQGYRKARANLFGL